MSAKGGKIGIDGVDEPGFLVDPTFDLDRDTSLDWLRLFMVPGMAHCGSGPGPNQVNWMAALERWREAGIAPDQLIASRVSENHVNMTRPICFYPAVAKYNGVGSTNDAANFACKQP